MDKNNKLHKLIEFRKEKNLMQKEMFSMLNISKSYYEKVEYGLAEAGRRFIQKMIEIFPDDTEKILHIFFNF